MRVEVVLVIIRPHRMYSIDAAIATDMSHVAWSMCMCVWHTGGLTSMPFGGADSYVGRGNHVLDAGQDGRNICSPNE